MNLAKKLLWAVTALSLTVTAAGCNAKGGDTQKPQSTASVQSNENKSTQYPVTIKDSDNDEITIDKEPMKVISIAPNITEIVYAIGSGSKLVGRTDYCDYPEEAKKVQSIGNLTDPNIEKITELKPDLIIASTHFKPEVKKKLSDLGIKVAVIYSENSFDSVYKNIEDIGAMLNAKQDSAKVVSDMKTKVEMVQNKVKNLSKPSLYYVVSYGKSQYTAGKDTFIGKMIEMAGAKNAADDVTGWTYSLEKLVEKNPDIMVCSKFNDSKKGIQAANGYKELTAVKNEKLYEIDNNLLDRQGPRLADGLYELAKIVHTEEF